MSQDQETYGGEVEPQQGNQKDPERAIEDPGQLQDPSPVSILGTVDPKRITQIDFRRLEKMESRQRIQETSPDRQLRVGDNEEPVALEVRGVQAIQEESRSDRQAPHEPLPVRDGREKRENRKLNIDD